MTHCHGQQDEIRGIKIQWCKCKTPIPNSLSRRKSEGIDVVNKEESLRGLDNKTCISIWETKEIKD